MNCFTYIVPSGNNFFLILLDLIGSIIFSISLVILIDCLFLDVNGSESVYILVSVTLLLDVNGSAFLLMLAFISKI